MYFASLFLYLSQKRKCLWTQGLVSVILWYFATYDLSYCAIWASNSGESFTVFVYSLTKLKSNNRTLGFLLKQFQNANVHMNISTWGDIEIGTI